MEGVRRGFMVLLIMVMALATKTALAAKYVVGGSQGWDLSTDLSSWASANTFRVGDQLVFKYTPGLHSVVELAGEKEYDKCDIGGAQASMNGGKNTVKLSKPGYRYFACGTLGHCGQGMKLKIKTLAVNDSASQAPASSSSASASSKYFDHSITFYVSMVLASGLFVLLNSV